MLSIQLSIEFIVCLHWPFEQMAPQIMAGDGGVEPPLSVSKTELLPLQVNPQLKSHLKVLPIAHSAIVLLNTVVVE